MQILRLTLLHLKRMISKRSVILMTLIMPTVVMCLVAFLTIGSGINSSDNTIYIDFVNNDKGTMGNALINQFKTAPDFYTSAMNESDAEYSVEHNSVAEAVVIPDDFSESLKNGVSPNLKVLKLSSDNSNITTDSKINTFINENLISKQINSSLQREIPTYKNITTELLKNSDLQKITATSKIITRDKTNTLGSQISTNLCVSFMMFTVIFIVYEILGRKDDGTLKRSLGTPNKKGVILSSIVLAFLIVGWIQVLLMVGTTSLFFHLSWGTSYLALFALFTSLILVVLGLGVLLCRIIKSANNAPLVCQMVINISCIIGGSYVPIEYFPNLLKNISYFVPQSWAIEGLTGVILNNKGLADVLPDIGILLLFALAFFTAGASTIKGLVES
ncbi:ABC transporter permease [Clostridium akagii]|uniref:ABC transporter permease n=1 Tax=Clostridium akagii TaxID=91623 RepID=UPI00047D0A41|nr:ABC transporter permease [Clostridium akagii]